MANCGVYEIRNMVNGHRYIGSSCHIMKRWQNHQEKLKRGIHHSRYLQRAYNLYGTESFKLFFLMQCGPKELIEQEQFWIDECQPEYNMSRHAAGGSLHGSGKGRIVSEETRRKSSISHKGQKGRPITPEHRAKINEGIRNNRKYPEHVSEQARANMIAAQRKRKEKGVSDEYRATLFAKLSALRKGKPGHANTSETKAKISATLMGHSVSKETIEKWASKQRGRTQSPERKQKTSEAMKVYFAKQRAETGFSRPKATRQKRECLEWT